MTENIAQILVLRLGVSRELALGCAAEIVAQVEPAYPYVYPQGLAIEMSEGYTEVGPTDTQFTREDLQVGGFLGELSARRKTLDP